MPLTRKSLHRKVWNIFPIIVWNAGVNYTQKVEIKRFRVINQDTDMP